MMWKRGFTLVEMMIVIAIIAIIASVAIPSLIKAKRSSNESTAAASLKTLNNMMAVFRRGRYQGRGYRYVWGDGGPATNRGKYCALYYEVANDGQPVQLIDNALAAADCRADGDTDAVRQAGSYVPVIKTGGGFSYLAAVTFPTLPRIGYWFALCKSRMNAYTYDLTHARNHYGMVGFPAEYGQTGECTFVVNEEGEVFGFDFGNAHFRNFPEDPLKDGWKMTL